MALADVRLTQDAFLTCMAHALSNEKEEIMGLLIGDIEGDAQHNQRTAYIWGTAPLSRSDKRPDRVEVSPQQMIKGQNMAEQMATRLCRPLRVIGWYHSHPHITIHPSHVDIRTQANYQMLDPGFVGLIVSVFAEHKTSKVSSMKCIAFQANEHDLTKEVEIPLSMTSQRLPGQSFVQQMVEMQSMLMEEEKVEFEEAIANGKEHPLTVHHHSGVYAKALCRHLDYSIVPLLETVDDRIAQCKARLDELQRERLRVNCEV